MKYLPWKDIFYFGPIWLFFVISLIWAVATDQFPENWTVGSAVASVLTVVTATAIFFWVIATKAEGKRLVKKFNLDKILR